MNSNMGRAAIVWRCATSSDVASHYCFCGPNANCPVDVQSVICGLDHSIYVDCVTSGIESEKTSATKKNVEMMKIMWKRSYQCREQKKQAIK